MSFEIIVTRRCVACSGVVVIIEIYGCSIFRWYHGQVTRGSTEQLLLGKEPGIYLVRDSKTSTGDFVLSVR